MAEQTIPQRPGSIFWVTFLIMCLLLLPSFVNRIDPVKRLERASRMDPATATPAQILELNINPVTDGISKLFSALFFATIIAVPTDVIRRWRYHRRIKQAQNELAVMQAVTSAPKQIDS